MRSTPPPSLPTSPPPDDGSEELAADGALPRVDPRRDARLGDALRRLDAVPAAEFERLRRTIVAAAESRLAELRAPAWWEWTARWASAAIPLALAAGIAALAFALRAGSPATVPAVETTASTSSYSPAFLSVVSQPGSGAQVADAVVGPASHDWLVSQVVQP